MPNSKNYDLDIDTTLGGSNASDYVIPSQKAIKAYVDNNSGGGGGSSTDVQINGTSITSQGVANIITNSAYNASSNKIATMNDLPTVPTKISDLTDDTATNPIDKADYATSAGSASSATSATTASKLGSTDVGSATKGIYLDDGTPKACTYSVSKDVPSNAVFTDTTYSNFTGADGSSAGTSGLVPAPTATDNIKFLKGDGTWATPAGGTVDQTYNASSTNAQSGVAIAGAGFLQKKGTITSSTTLTTLAEGIYEVNGVAHSGFPDGGTNNWYGILIQYGGTYKPQLFVAGIPAESGLYYRRYLTASSAFTGWYKVPVDSTLVHLAGAETITGNKTFSGTVALGSNASATTPTSTDSSTKVATTKFVKDQGYTSNTGTVTDVSITNGIIYIQKDDVTSTDSISISSSNVTTALGYTPENNANIVTSISSSSTDTQYPSAKCVWDNCLHSVTYDSSTQTLTIS